MSGFTLKKIETSGIAHALEKAERYRLLNDPAQAESICRDVLEVEPAHQDALRHLILALTDQFHLPSGGSGTSRETRNYIAQLTD